MFSVVRSTTDSALRVVPIDRAYYEMPMPRPGLPSVFGKIRGLRASKPRSRRLRASKRRSRRLRASKRRSRRRSKRVKKNYSNSKRR